MCMAQVYAELLRAADGEPGKPATRRPRRALPDRDPPRDVPAIARTVPAVRSGTLAKPWYKMDFSYFR